MTYIGIFLLVVFAAKLIYWFVAKMIWEEEPKATEVHTVRTSDGWRIKLYRSFDKENAGEPIFLCPGYTGNPFSFTYPKNASMVDSLVERGFDCWVIDLRGNRRSEPPIGTSRYTGRFKDHYTKDIPSALDHICTITGYEQVHWVGHSMGGLLLYAYAATQDTERIASVTSIGAPPGFTDLNITIYPKVNSFITTFPFIAERYMRGLVPLGQLITREDNPLPMNGANMSQDVTFFNIIEMPPVEVTRYLFDCAENHRWVLEDSDIDMEDFLPTIELPIHLLAAPLDNLGMERAIESFYDSVASRDKQLTILSRAHGTELDYDHVDMIYGKNARTEVYEPIGSWIQAHAMKKSARPKKRKVAPKAKLAATESTDVLKLDPPVATPAAVSGESSLWGKALEDASNILSNFEGEEVVSKPRKKAIAKKKSIAKKPAAKKKTTKKKAVAKKPTAKKKAVVKKKAASKKKPTSKKKPVAKKKPTTKKKVAAVKKKAPVKKKAAKKKVSAKKPSTKKPSPKKKAATKKKTKTKAKKKSTK